MSGARWARRGSPTLQPAVDGTASQLVDELPYGCMPAMAAR